MDENGILQVLILEVTTSPVQLLTVMVHQLLLIGRVFVVVCGYEYYFVEFLQSGGSNADQSTTLVFVVLMERGPEHLSLCCSHICQEAQSPWKC